MSDTHPLPLRPAPAPVAASRAALRRACAAVGGQSALARRLGKRPGHIWAWLNRGIVPAEMCAPIEAATGGAVTRRDLRPDLFASDGAAA